MLGRAATSRCLTIVKKYGIVVGHGDLRLAQAGLWAFLAPVR